MTLQTTVAISRELAETIRGHYGAYVNISAFARDAIREKLAREGLNEKLTDPPARLLRSAARGRRITVEKIEGEPVGAGSPFATSDSPAPTKPGVLNG